MKKKEEIWAESIIDSIGRQESQKPSDQLLQNIMAEIDPINRKVSMKWVGMAAALIIGLFIGEFLVIHQQNSGQAELLEIVPESNNILYYE